MRAGVFFIIAVLFLANGVFAAEAKNSERELIKKEKKLEDIEKRLRETGKLTEKARSKESSVLTELDGVNRLLNEKRDELKKIVGGIKKIEASIGESNGKIDALEREKDSIGKAFNMRIRGIYKMRRGGLAKALFSADSTLTLAKRYRAITVILDSDIRLLKDVEGNLKELNDENARRGELMNLAYSKKESLEAKRMEIDSELKKKKALLAVVKKEKESYLAMTTELGGARSELLELIKKLRTEEKAVIVSGFASKKGSLKMPVDGPVVSTYGKVTNLKFNTVTFNNGITIKTAYGAKVKSIYQGSVVYVGWLKGYGQVLIVDNGGGFYTLFAYLSKALKDKGSKVEEGTVIGLAGDSGPNELTALYFEIREKGVPRDPLAWINEKKFFD